MPNSAAHYKPMGNQRWRAGGSSLQKKIDLGAKPGTGAYRVHACPSLRFIVGSSRDDIRTWLNEPKGFWSGFQIFLACVETDEKRIYRGRYPGRGA